MFGLLRSTVAPGKIREYLILVRQIEDVLQYNPGKSKMQDNLVVSDTNVMIGIVYASRKVQL